jgi:nucleotide-binding universal stress UspA family protein
MRILLATDGSRYSSEATRECVKLASNFEDVTVKIITSVDNFTPLAQAPFVTSEEFLANIESQMRENAETSISEAVRILRDSSKNLNFETEILLGSPKKLIVQEAEKWKADLIVVGSHGYGFWGRAFLGSVSDAVVHHSPCSVLVVRSKVLEKERISLEAEKGSRPGVIPETCLAT